MRIPRMERVAVVVLLVCATVAVYAQVVNHQFVEFDDYEYVVENVALHDGVSLDGVIWAFTRTHSGNWHPLTWISHMLDVQLFGMNPAGHHGVNALLHLANTLLLLAFLVRASGSFWRSSMVAALFALHPLHVESVAWASERKDVLSTFFWMLTMLAYVRYCERPGWHRYLPVPALLILGLLAKPMLVTLPCVLLLLDVWPLARLRDARGRWDLSRVKPLLIEKIPLFVIMLAAAFTTFFVQRFEGAVVDLGRAPFDLRVANALHAYVAYLGKTFWPNGLAVFYPLQTAGGPSFSTFVELILLGVVTGSVLRAVRRYPYLCVGWLWYLGTLVPVIGLIQVGAQGMADRYTYVPLIGIFMMLAWGVTELLERMRASKIALAPAACVILLLLTISSWVQVGRWKDSFTLFEHSRRHTVPNYEIHNGMGLALMRVGRYEEAIEEYRTALELAPGVAHVYGNLAFALYKAGDTDTAIEYYRAVLKVSPSNGGAHFALGLVLSERGEFDEALLEFQKAVRLRPEHLSARLNLGAMFAQQGRYPEAIEQFESVVQQDPAHRKARSMLERARREHRAIHSAAGS